MTLSLNEIIEATGAQIIKNDLKGDEKFTFSTDTRTIKAGEIYLPLKGENFDGEDFIDKAIEAGAAGYFLSEKKTRKEISSRFTFHVSLILQVEDTLSAYLQLARFYRRKINPKTIAITGSCGKTTTKEMAYCVASEKFKTHKSELNFNNEIGMPKTILSMPSDTQVLILEMGMRGLGEIETLSRYSEPDISIISNVGTAHIGRLGSRENVAKAKCEIVQYQNPNGTFIAHDDDLIKKTVDFCGEKVYFSLSDVKVLEHSTGYSKFEYKGFEYELNIEGDYNMQNALAVIEMGFKLKMTPAEIAAGLKKYSPIEKRWEIQEIKGFKIINDSYNANPDSMKAAIKTALDTASRPLWFVLGDMGELGENEALYHSQIGDFLVDGALNDKNVKVFTVGNLANEISQKLNDNGIFSQNFKTNPDAARYIVENAQKGTTIVLKASRAMKFEEIINEVTK